MSTLEQIEAAIERLSPPEREELIRWFGSRDRKVSGGTDAELWLRQARGAAIDGVTTDHSMAKSRGED